jgi:hypothetical protein
VPVNSVRAMEKDFSSECDISRLRVVCDEKNMEKNNKSKMISFAAEGTDADDEEQMRQAAGG